VVAAARDAPPITKFGNLAVLLALGCAGMDLIVVQGAADQAVMQGGAAARDAPPIMPRR
jgi:hypothetical protein